MEQNNRSGRIATRQCCFAAGGFTLVEIMVVVAIIAIIALFAGPELINFGPNIRVKAVAGDLHSNLQKMKVEAIKRNRDVLITFNPVICPAHPSATVPVPGGTYTIYIDVNNNGTVEPLIDIPFNMSDDSNDPAPDPDYDMPRNTALCINASLPAGATVFKFSPQGFWLNSAVPPVPVAAVFQIQNDKGRAYQIAVSISGGIKTTKLP